MTDLISRNELIKDLLEQIPLIYEGCIRGNDYGHRAIEIVKAGGME